jgi:hypothetical protein
MLTVKEWLGVVVFIASAYVLIDGVASIWG